MSAKELFRGKSEPEILEFLTLEGQLIIQLDAFSTDVKRKMLANLKKIEKLPEWMQNILLEDINSTVANRVELMEKIFRADEAKGKNDRCVLPGSAKRLEEGLDL